MTSEIALKETHELRDLVRNTLAQNPHFAGRNLRVDLDQQDIVLRGAVRSYYHKQVAQESIRRIDGIGSIRNELEVVA